MTLDDTKRSLLVAQDIKLVKALAGNNAKLRERALKNLRKWFERRSSKIPFTEEEFLRMWKGLFYAMWMSDKPLVQEECAEKLANLVHFPNVQTSLLFFKCGLAVIATEWFGIDQLRLDKFQMFVRRFLRQGLLVLKNNHWQKSTVANFGEIVFMTVLKTDSSNSNHLGLTMHIIEIFLEELAKVSKGENNPSLITVFLIPFVKHLATLDDPRLISHIKKYLFYHLLQQSDEGQEYQAKFEAWKGEGFPGGSIDAMQNVRDFDSEAVYSDEEVDVTAMDPRAGEVDVVLRQLKFNAKDISKLLLKYRFTKGSTTKGRIALTDLAKKFSRLSKGKFPLGITKIAVVNNNGYSTNIRKSVNRLVKFEKGLQGVNRKRKFKDTKKDLPLLPPKRTKINHTNSATMFQEQLENFIKTSEGEKVQNMKKPKLIKKAAREQAPSTVIRRDSGMWVVEPLQLTENSHGNKLDNSLPLAVFPQTEWDLPPKEGEVEIFVPANKYKRKLENIAKQSGKSPTYLLNEALEKLVKPRYSLDTNLVKNPFSKLKYKTPTSEKKVKINLKLNSSQEVSEHRAQIRRSPAIPFDAHRKPIKPLLKFTVNSPIDPFCKRKL